MQLQSESINELMAALSKAQGEIKNAIKDVNNTFFKSRYADLASVKEACQTPLTTNNLAVTQTTTIMDGTLVLVTTLGHSSGQFIRGLYPLNPVKNDPQGMGSAMTYARRYALAAITGVVQDDDDGEAAQGRTSAQSSAGLVSMNETYNATHEHKKILVAEAKALGLEPNDKELMTRLNYELVSKKIKIDDISKYLKEAK